MTSKLITSIGVFAPFIALAATDLITPILSNVKDALDVAVPIAITLALIYFIWHVVKYVVAPGEEEKADARKKMLYGVIGMFVIIAVWGLVNFIATYLGVSPTANPIVIPFVPG